MGNTGQQLIRSLDEFRLRVFSASHLWGHKRDYSGQRIEVCVKCGKKRGPDVPDNGCPGR